MARVLTLRPPAKINLTLGVGPRLENGFHEVRTILQTIDVSDTLTLTPRRGPLALSVKQRRVAAGPGLAPSPGVPGDRTNLVWRAADALWRAAGRVGDPRDVRVMLEKHIPAAAGLGGGSADAAAALVGLNRVWDLGVSRRDLVHLAAGLGADVPFFLVGGTAMGLGRGDQVYPLEDIAPRGVVLIKPSFGVSTADAYGWLDADRAAGVAGDGWASGNLPAGWPNWPVVLADDFEGPVSRRHPCLRDAVDACFREGALAAAMTGSGSAVFGVFPSGTAPKAARRLKRPDWLVLATRTLSRAQSGRRMGL